MDPKELAMTIVHTLDSKKAKDIHLLHTTEVTTLADYFVIATATSSTHLGSLSDEVGKVLKEQHGEMAAHIEGRRNGAWLLLDYSCVVVHLFLEEARQFYDLERLWKDAQEVELKLEP